MRLKSLVLAALICVTTTAFAQVGPGRIQVIVLPGVVKAEVYNPNYEPILCDGQVFGLTMAGFTHTAYFVQQILPAAGYRQATVIADFRNPFVNGWANIVCRFL